MIFSKQKRILSAFLSLTMIGTMVASVPFTASAATSKSPYVAFSVFENNTWKASKNGAAGQTGKKYKVSAIKAALKNAPKGASLNVSIYENKKWISNSKGKVEGSAVKNTKLYASALKATLKGASGYTLSYKVYENKKWLSGKSGATAGTTSKKLAIEAVKFTITKKSTPTPAPDEETPTVSSVSSVADVTVANGTAAADAVAALAKVAPTVDETLSDGTTKTGVAVTWTAPTTYVATTNGTYVFTGTLADVDGVDNSAAVTATANVIVADPIKDAIQKDTKNIVVDFTNAVDTTKAKVSLTQGSATIYTTAVFAADGKSVTLTTPSAIVAGDYTVNVTGITTDPLTAKVTVAAAVATKIAATTTAITAGTDSVFDFVVSDQFGSDMGVYAADVTAFVYDTTAATALTATVVASKSEFTLNTSNAVVKTGDSVRVILTYNGLNVTTTYTVGNQAAPTGITLGTVLPLTGDTRISVSKPGYVLPVTLKDQYGNATKFATTDIANGIIKVVSSNTAIVDNTSFAVNADGNITFTTGATAGTATITVIVNATGTVATATVTVNDTAAVKTVSITAPTTVVAAGDSISLPVSAVDQYGSSVTAAGTVTSSTPAVVANGATTNIANGKLNFVAVAAGTTTLTVANATGTTLGTITITVEAARYASHISATTIPTNYEVGTAKAVTADELTIYDQYNTVIPSTSTGLTFAVAKADLTASIFTVPTATITAGSTVGSEVLNVTATYGGQTTPVFPVTVNAIATTSITSYSIATVPTILAGSATDAAHNAVLVLNGVTASGASVVLANSTVTNATSSDPSVATVTVSNGVVTVAGTSTATAKGTTNIDLYNALGTKLATTVVTADTATPVATTVAFTAPIAIAVNATATAAVTVNDQYGIAMTGLTGSFWASSNTAVATVDQTGVVTAGVGSGTATLTYVTSNGKVATTTITVS